MVSFSSFLISSFSFSHQSIHLTISKQLGPVPAAATTKPPAKRARKTFVLDGSDGDGSAITLTSDESRGAKGRVMRGREKSGKRARPDDDDDDEEEGDGMTDTQYVTLPFPFLFRFFGRIIPLRFFLAFFGSSP